MSTSTNQIRRSATFLARDPRPSADGTRRVARTSSTTASYAVARYLDDKDEYFHDLRAASYSPSNAHRSHQSSATQQSRHAGRDVTGAGSWSAKHGKATAYPEELEL